LSRSRLKHSLGGWEATYIALARWPLPVPRASKDTGGHFKGIVMLYTVVVVLLALWILGMVTAFTAGGLLHILLVLAVIVLVYQLVTGRRV
jgi:Family of unknown function (DUF5670)